MALDMALADVERLLSGPVKGEVKGILAHADEQGVPEVVGDQYPMGLAALLPFGWLWLVAQFHVGETGHF